MRISYKVEIDPIPQARPRFGKNGTYQPSRCKQYKALVKSAAQAAMDGREPLTGELNCQIKVFRKFKPTSRRYGDVDNHIKSILDGMNGIVYLDDCQIIRCSIEKGTAKTPHIEVILTDDRKEEI